MMGLSSSPAWKKSLLLTALTFIAERTLAFELHHHHHVAILPRHAKGSENRYDKWSIITTLFSSTTEEEEASTKTIIQQQEQRRGGPSSSGSCYYKRIDGSWKPRKELNRLFVGERLFAIRLLERCVSYPSLLFIKFMVRTHDVVYSNSFIFL